MNVINCFHSTFGAPGEPAPAVQAFCYLPRLSQGFWVTFLVDTGASGTAIHGAPAWSLQSRLRPETLEAASGVGGSNYYFGERATLVFTDKDGTPVSRTFNRIDIQLITAHDIAANHGIPQLPSLLGRDILNRWKLTYDCPNDIMCITKP
jgi:hypothetical protein